MVGVKGRNGTGSDAKEEEEGCNQSIHLSANLNDCQTCICLNCKMYLSELPNAKERGLQSVDPPLCKSAITP